MRIPSQFNDSSLYGRGKRPPADSTHSYRRLLRLLVALVLVVMVIRQAARPQMYEVFFGGPGSVGDSEVISVGSEPPAGRSELGAAGPPNGSATGVGQSELEVDEDRSRQAADLVDAMPAEIRRRWHGVFGRESAGLLADESEDRKLAADSIDRTIRLVESQQSMEPSIKDQWKSFFREPNDPMLAKSMLEALDRAATNRVVDGSVWRSEDYDAFYRQLSQADKIQPSEASAVAVLPLLQQPEVYRGQVVRVRGRVARAERTPAAENPFGVSEYWQLWLEPSGGGDRPLVAIVPTVSQSVAAVGPDGKGGKPPTVWIVGRFFKRLAYRSGIGADLAPVVIGYTSSQPLATNRGVEALPETLPTTEKEIDGFQLLLGIGTACLIGIALAAVTMWRTSMTAKRSRAMRQSKQRLPDGLLNRAGGSEEERQIDE